MILSHFPVQGMTGYRTSLCWGTKADLRVCSQDPWKGLRITTNVSAWYGRHLRLDSAHLACVTCPTNLPVWLFQGVRDVFFIKLPSLHLLIIILTPTNASPTGADLAPGSSSPFIGQLLAPPPQLLVTCTADSELLILWIHLLEYTPS